MKHYTFTSESVTEGHPDKVADLISDTIADYIIDNNQSHRAAIETLVTTNKVCVSGEYKSSKNSFYGPSWAFGVWSGSKLYVIQSI